MVRSDAERIVVTLEGVPVETPEQTTGTPAPPTDEATSQFEPFERSDEEADRG